MLDQAELALHARVMEGDGWAIQFVLKTLGKERGYVERQELQRIEPVTLRIVEEIVPAGTSDRPCEPCVKGAGSSAADAGRLASQKAYALGEVVQSGDLRIRVMQVRSDEFAGHYRGHLRGLAS